METHTERGTKMFMKLLVGLYGNCRKVTSTYFVKIKLVQWGVESNWIHSALRTLIGLLCQPRVIMMMEKLVE
jgi:hypothetical protein